MIYSSNSFIFFLFSIIEYVVFKMLRSTFTAENFQWVLEQISTFQSQFLLSSRKYNIILSNCIFSFTQNFWVVIDSLNETTIFYDQQNGRFITNHKLIPTSCFLWLLQIPHYWNCSHNLFISQEQLLLSVLPEHVAVQMRQDLDRADSQFKKIYMSRHENVR